MPPISSELATIPAYCKIGYASSSTFAPCSPQVPWLIGRETMLHDRAGMPILHVLQARLFFDKRLPDLYTAGQSIRPEILVAKIKRRNESLWMLTEQRSNCDVIIIAWNTGFLHLVCEANCGGRSVRHILEENNKRFTLQQHPIEFGPMSAASE